MLQLIGMQQCNKKNPLVLHCKNMTRCSVENHREYCTHAIHSTLKKSFFQTTNTINGVALTPYTLNVNLFLSILKVKLEQGTNMPITPGKTIVM